MDYLSAEFGDFSFSRFCFIVRTHTHSLHRHTDRTTDADLRYTHATTVGIQYWYRQLANVNKARLLTMNVIV